MPLKAVIFDWGGVLVRTLDQAPRIRWEQALGLARGQSEDIVFGAETGYAVQLGRVSDEDHWRWVQRRLGLDDADVARFRTDFFSEDRLDADLAAYLGRLRTRYHVGLLSNASSNARRFFAAYGLLDAFDSVTISGEEGIMKPAEAIFRVALTRAGVQPGEAVYVDDVLANVEAARRLGMVAVHFQDPTAARRQLAELTGVA